MSQRLTRKEIKRDEFATAVGRTVDYAESHGRTIALAIGAVLLAAAIFVGLRFYLGHRSGKAGAALADAIEVYAAPIQATGAKPNDPEKPSFANSASRRARAKELFTGIQDRYGMSDAADVASLYLAQIAADEGRLDEARKLWTAFADDHDHMLASEARLNLLHLDRKQGKAGEVVGQLQAMVDDAEAPLPQDAALYELAVTYEEMKRDAEAKKAYQRILDEFPQSPYRSAAQQKVAAGNPAVAESPLPF